MEPALPNLSLITHFEWSSPYKDCVFKVAAIGFSPTAGPKQTEALLCADTTKNGTLHSHTRDKNVVNECQCRVFSNQFLTKLEQNILKDVKRATPRLQERLTHAWYLIHPPVVLDINTTADSTALILRMILLGQLLFL